MGATFGLISVECTGYDTNATAIHNKYELAHRGGRATKKGRFFRGGYEPSRSSV